MDNPGKGGQMSKFKELKEACWKANMEVPRHKLAIYTFGNVSALDTSEGVFAIKPSGVPYDEMKPADMVIIFRPLKYLFTLLISIHPEVKPVGCDLKKILRILKKGKSLFTLHG